MKDLGKIGKYQRVKKSKEYPWPWGGQLDRTIMIYDDDILRRSEKGIFTKITGLCCLNIHIPEEDIIEAVDNEKHLIML